MLAGGSAKLAFALCLKEGDLGSCHLAGSDALSSNPTFMKICRGGGSGGSRECWGEDEGDWRGP